LKEWVPKVRELASKTKQLYVLFNNNYEHKAARNASQMRLMLDRVSVALLRNHPEVGRRVRFPGAVVVVTSRGGSAANL